jgi:hypothetical protein
VTAKGIAKIQKRLETLTELLDSGQLADVMGATEKLRASGHSPEVVRIRRAYYRHEHALPVEKERNGLPTELQPRAAQLILPRGVALKTHLVALYAAQCQAAPGRPWRNTIPIAADETSEFSWSGLMAVHARHDPNGRRSSRRENKERQITEAVKKLGTLDLVEFPHAGGTRPFRDFRLLSEGKRGNTAAPIPYRVPTTDNKAVLEMPVTFFTKGWVHLLTTSEIVSYLMWLDLNAGRLPEVPAPFIPGLERAGLYGTTRDTYETHRPLEAFGLLDVEFAEGRHDDGKVASGSDKLCHRVTTVPGALDREAGPVIRKVIEQYAVLGLWDQPIGPFSLWDQPIGPFSLWDQPIGPFGLFRPGRA